jgi:hypothetical protein
VQSTKDAVRCARRAAPERTDAAVRRRGEQHGRGGGRRGDAQTSATLAHTTRAQQEQLECELRVLPPPFRSRAEWSIRARSKISMEASNTEHAGSDGRRISWPRAQRSPSSCSPLFLPCVARASCPPAALA